MITLDDIRAAHARIAPHTRRTPTMTVAGADLGLERDVELKLEYLQVTGTFKPRGAFNTLLSNPSARTICAASGGNHGVAVAHAASRLGLSARIFVPEISSPAKVARIRESGAELVVGGPRYADALAACDAYAAESGAFSVHAYDGWGTIAGQGTVGLEWEAQSPDALDTVLVAAGGGGLVAGVARWFEGRVKVVAVEPEGSRALGAALAAGGPVDVEVSSVAADSLGAKNVFARVHEVCARYLHAAITVPDSAIVEAQRRLWLGTRIAAEPGGATALAALICGAYRPAANERVGVLACGANVDLAALASIVDGTR